MNHLHPDDVVSSVTYVKSLDENISGDMESLCVFTMAMKNVSVLDLEKLEFPTELFVPGLTTKQVEKICKEKIPSLSKKIVVLVERNILRQANKSEVFLL